MPVNVDFARPFGALEPVVAHVVHGRYPRER